MVVCECVCVLLPLDKMKSISIEIKNRTIQIEINFYSCSTQSNIEEKVTSLLKKGGIGDKRFLHFRSMHLCIE